MSSSNAITALHLSKTFKSPKIYQGSCFGTVKHYLFPNYQTHTAVNDLSFSVDRGESIGFIGPNGAGKSTTIKMLTGILAPSQGSLTVLGKNPIKDRIPLSYQISAVFGSSSRLWHHLPVHESFALLAAIYDIPPLEYKQRVDTLSETFGIVSLLTKSARQLSLGERMRCELVASFLHKPSIVFLDEPTIGLDITAKTVIRDLLCRLSKEEGVTLILTSHDMDDIEIVCNRVIMVDKGKLLLDDSLHHLKTKYIKKKQLTVVCEEEHLIWDMPGTIVLETSPHVLKLEIDLASTSKDLVIPKLLKQYTVKDISAHSPSLETIIETLYKHES